MDYPITRELLDKARALIKMHHPYDDDDPILDRYDGNTDVERRRSTLLVRIFKENNIDPYDDNDYGDLSE